MTRGISENRMLTLAEGIGILFSKMPCQCLCSTTLYNALSLSTLEKSKEVFTM
jgi:hypothetical protein